MTQCNLATALLYASIWIDYQDSSAYHGLGTLSMLCRRKHNHSGTVLKVHSQTVIRVGGVAGQVAPASTQHRQNAHNKIEGTVKHHANNHTRANTKGSKPGSANRHTRCYLTVAQPLALVAQAPTIRVSGSHSVEGLVHQRARQVLGALLAHGQPASLQGVAGAKQAAAQG